MGNLPPTGPPPAPPPLVYHQDLAYYDLGVRVEGGANTSRVMEWMLDVERQNSGQQQQQQPADLRSQSSKGGAVKTSPRYLYIFVWLAGDQFRILLVSLGTGTWSGSMPANPNSRGTKTVTKDKQRRITRTRRFLRVI